MEGVGVARVVVERGVELDDRLPRLCLRREGSASGGEGTGKQGVCDFMFHQIGLGLFENNACGVGGRSAVDSQYIEPGRK